MRSLAPLANATVPEPDQDPTRASKGFCATCPARWACPPAAVNRKAATATAAARRRRTLRAQEIGDGLLMVVSRCRTVRSGGADGWALVIVVALARRRSLYHAG